MEIGRNYSVWVNSCPWNGLDANDSNQRMVRFARIDCLKMNIILISKANTRRVSIRQVCAS